MDKSFSFPMDSAPFILFSVQYLFDTFFEKSGRGWEGGKPSIKWCFHNKKACTTSMEIEIIKIKKGRGEVTVFPEKAETVVQLWYLHCGV